MDRRGFVKILGSLPVLGLFFGENTASGGYVVGVDPAEVGEDVTVSGVRTVHCPVITDERLESGDTSLSDRILCAVERVLREKPDGYVPRVYGVATGSTPAISIDVPAEWKLRLAGDFRPIGAVQGPFAVECYRWTYRNKVYKVWLDAGLRSGAVVQANWARPGRQVGAVVKRAEIVV